MPERKGYYTAYLQAATEVGIMLAALMFLLVSYLRRCSAGPGAYPS
jgi:hypothetical protein